MIFNLPANFWFENVHFITYALLALSFFVIGWLNYDSYKETRDAKLAYRFFGFFVLALWSLGSAAKVDVSIVTRSLWVAELVGVAAVAIGFILDPLPRLPSKNATAKSDHIAVISFVPPLQLAWLPIISLVGWLILLIRAWLFSTVGLTREYAGFALGLLFIFLGRVVSIVQTSITTHSVLVDSFIREFGTFWIVEHGLLLIGAIILLRWAFSYLHFRPLPLLFASFSSAMLVLFLIATMVFTGFLFQSSQNNTIASLKRNAAVFELSLSELKSKVNLAAYSLGQRSGVQTGVATNTSSSVLQALGDPLTELGVGSVMVTNRAGEVLAQNASMSDVGASIINDPTVARALKGIPTSSLVVVDQLHTPHLVIRGAYPVVVDNKVSGVVVADYPVDQPFIENVKKITQLEVTLHAGTTRVATTLTDATGRSITGTKSTNAEVNALVTNTTKDNWAWAGTEQIIQKPYLVAYRAIIDADNVVIGSLMVGHDKSQLETQINQSVKLTFLTITILILLSLLPIALVSRVLARALKA